MSNLSRRRFIKAATNGLVIAAGIRPSAIAALTTPHLAPLAPAKPSTDSSNFGGVQIGCMTYSFRDRPLGEALRNIAQIGFSSIELYSGHLDPLKATDKEIVSWRNRFAAAGVRITSYYVDFAEAQSDDEVNRNFEAGRMLGVNILSSTVPKRLLPRLDRFCQKFRMSLGLHNEVYPKPEPGQFERPEDFLTALHHSSPWINLTLDVGHYYAAGYDPVEFIRQHHDRVVSVHLKDEERDARHTDLPFGEGTTPLVAIVKTLQQVRFKHAANIEWEVPHSDPVKGVGDALTYLKRALT